MHYVYVIQSLSDSGKFYIGFSSDLRSRVEAHNAGKNTSTKGHKWRVAYYEAYASREYAHRREQSLKRNKRMRDLLIKRVRESLAKA